MKLADWARCEGINYTTAYRWWTKGQLPFPARQLPSGMILIDAPDPRAQGKTVVCARLGEGSDTPDSLVARLTEWATGDGRSVDGVVVGADGFADALADPSVRVIVADGDSLCCQTAKEQLRAVLAAQGRELVLVGT